MLTSEYEREYDVEVPDAIEDAETMGTRPEPDYDSSPGVSVDGSIQGENSGRQGVHDKNNSRTPFSVRQMLFIVALVLIGIGGVLLQSGIVSL